MSTARQRENAFAARFLAKHFPEGRTAVESALYAHPRGLKTLRRLGFMTSRSAINYRAHPLQPHWRHELTEAGRRAAAAAFNNRDQHS